MKGGIKMVCECCGAKVGEEENGMCVCENCFSTYIMGDDGTVIAKYLVSDEFREIWNERKALFNKGSEQEKEALCKELLKKSHNNPALWNLLGVIYRGRNQLDEAEKCYREALMLNPKYGQLYLNIAILKYSKNDLDGAVEFAEKAMVYMSPNYDNYKVLLGNYALFVGKKGDMEKAEDYLNQAEASGYKNCDAIRESLGLKTIKEMSSSGGGFFSKLKGNINRAREDAAIRKAYKIEQEKRKPHVKKIKHERPLTPTEQAEIDMLEAQMNSEAGQRARAGAGLMDSMLVAQPYMLKISEIMERAIWYEEVTIPPEVDPSIPIVIDEDAIRRSVRKF